MKYSNSFTHDLNFGEKAEDWVNNIFSKGCKIEVKSDKKDDEFEFWVLNDKDVLVIEEA